MNRYLCHEFINHLDQDRSLASGQAPEQVSKWLEQLGLPLGLLRFMQWDWPQRDCMIARVSILSSTSIHTHEATAPLLKHQLVNAGSAPNGDWFAIDYSSEACVPGFISHDQWSPWSEVTGNPREHFEPIARSFESFLFRAVEGRYLPIDYYAASDFNAFLADERNAYPGAAPGSST